MISLPGPWGTPLEKIQFHLQGIERVGFFILYQGITLIRILNYDILSNYYINVKLSFFKHNT